MAAVDDLLAHVDDKPTIGLLLCRTKNNVVAECALRGSTMPIGIAEWATNVSTALSEELTSTLPRIEDIEAELLTICPSRFGSHAFTQVKSRAGTAELIILVAW